MCQKCSSLVRGNKHENYIKHMHKFRLKTTNDGANLNIKFNPPTWCCANMGNGHIKIPVNLSTVLLALFYIITLLPVTTAQLSWKTRPVDTSVRENEAATIDCEVNNLAGLSMEWRQYLDNGDDNTFFINDARHSAPDRFTVDNNGYGYTLQVSGATKDDDAEYQCGVATWSEKVRARLTVLVEPALPQIILNVSESNLQENDYVEFRCSSSGGNPAPNFTWLRNEEEMEQTHYIPPPSKFGEAQSVLVWRLSRNDHQVLVSCQAENEANLGNPVMTGKVLDIKYSPVLDLGPHDPYKVILSETETLTCNTDANPDVTDNGVQWFKDSLFLETGSSLTITNIEKTDAGVYECQASNGIGDAQSKDLSLDVLYGPEIALHFSNGQVQGSEVHIKEGLAINITCISDGNPAVTNGNIQWLKAGVAVQTGPSLYIASVQRSDAGSYSCVASNTLQPSGGQEQTRQDEENFLLRVLYSPGSATITVPDLVIKGDQAVLICTVDDIGDPPGTLLWTRLGESTILKNSSVLDIPSVQFSDHGEYVCTPHNSIGPGQSDIQLLDVQERPEWLGPTLPPTKTVNVNSTLQVVCQARGKPLPQVTWSLDGFNLHTSDGWFTVTESEQPIDEHSWNITSILRWQGPNRSPTLTSLRHSDAGNYTCHVSNDLSSLATSMNLLVQYPPIVVPSSEKVAIDRNQSATMSCLSHAYPGTAYEWYNDTVKLVPGGRIHIADEEIGGEFPFRSQITISDVSNVDLGDYFCQGCNGMGCNVAGIFLTVKDVPDQPSSVQIQSKTWESVSLHWNQGFDGGYDQTFYIMYLYYNDTTHGIDQVEVEAGSTDNFNVTNLFPSVNYTFTVFSSNFLGLSDPSNSAWSVTSEFLVTPPGRVEYDSDERLLVFTSPSSNYCARIEINSGSSWEVYEACAPAEGSIQIQEGWEVRDIRLALCLTRRQDICSQMVYAEFVGEDLPKETIIIVGCVCGGVVVILTIVLVVLCCKRHKAKQQYEKQEASQMHPVISNSTTPTTSQDTVLKPALKAGVDNPGLDQVDQGRGSTRQPRDTVFITDTAAKPPALPYGYDGRQNGRPNGHIAQNPDITWDAPPPNYDNLRNEELYNHKRPVSPMDKNTLYLDNPYAPDPRKELGSYSDSGVSTPDPQKPKKIIYEVIV